MKRKYKAFTLIEMMIAIFIISMLLVMAVPRYKKLIFKSKTEEAKAIIQSIIFAEERYRQENGYYYPNDGSAIKNERVISKNLKINLSNSNNFNYFIKDAGGSDNNITITAVLRANNNLCNDETISTVCKQIGTSNGDDWLNQYNRSVTGTLKHYIEFQYPTKLTGDYVENGISYEHLHDD